MAHALGSVAIFRDAGSGQAPRLRQSRRDPRKDMIPPSAPVRARGVRADQQRAHAKACARMPIRSWAYFIAWVSDMVLTPPASVTRIATVWVSSGFLKLSIMLSVVSSSDTLVQP
jgi:hypothetical protein